MFFYFLFLLSFTSSKQNTKTFKIKVLMFKPFSFDFQMMINSTDRYWTHYELNSHWLQHHPQVNFNWNNLFFCFWCAFLLKFLYLGPRKIWLLSLNFLMKFSHSWLVMASCPGSKFNASSAMEALRNMAVIFMDGEKMLFRSFAIDTEL